MTLTSLTISNKKALADALAGSRTRSKFALTTSALNSEPSWKVTPSRNLNSHVVSSICSYSSASTGTSSKFSSCVTNGS